MSTAYDPGETLQRIQGRVANELQRLSPHLRDWAKQHIVSPRVVKLFKDLTNLETEEFWLVTDNFGGMRDSSYRVIYSEDLDSFGLSVVLNDGRDCCMGFHGDFDNAVQSM